VDVTAAVGNTLTVIRGVDGTTASPHSAGVQVYHGVSARDADEANDHVNKTTNIHGVSGGLVGTSGDQGIAGVKNFTGVLQTAGSPVVSTAGDQTISGIKTFNTRPVVTGNGDVVTTGGTQTVTGNKTWTGPEVHNGAETHTGVETHNGAATFNSGLTVVGTLTATNALFSLGYAGTTDASGFLTVTHGAGFTPVSGWAVTNNPGSSFAQFHGIDNITGTTCRLRFASTEGGPVISQPVTGRLFLARP
jgi:hypothetical protein